MTVAQSELFAEWWHCTRKEYDEDTDYVRSSELKDFWECPTIYKARYIDRTMPRKNESREMFVGTALHSLVLEGEVTWKVAGTCGVLLTSGKNKGKPCGKNAASKDHAPYFDVDERIWVCGTHKGNRRVVAVTDALTEKEANSVERMAAAIVRDEKLADWLSHRKHEKAARSVDPKTGIKRKALLDILLPHTMTIADIKTTAEFNSESIWRRISKFGYGFSLAHYEEVVRDVARVTTGRELPNFDWTLIIAESVPPYRVTDWPIGDEAQDICRADYRRTLNEFAECRRTGVWPQREMEKGMPQWFAFVHDFKREGSR